MLPQVTSRQKEIYDFLLKGIREKGHAPSIPEIGVKFRIASTNGVSDHLKALELAKNDLLRKALAVTFLAREELSAGTAQAQFAYDGAV